MEDVNIWAIVLIVVLVVLNCILLGVRVVQSFDRRSAERERRKEESIRDKEVAERFGRLDTKLEAADKINQATYRMLRVAGFQDTDGNDGRPQPFGFANEANPKAE